MPGLGGRAMHTRDPGYGGAHSHFNSDLVFLARVWPEKQVLENSMLPLKASALGKEI